MPETPEILPQKTREEQADEFINSLGEMDFGALGGFFQDTLKEQIKEFLLSTEIKELVLSGVVGKLTLPDETLKKIIKEKAKIEQLPFLENFVDDTKQELDAHGKAIETDTVIQDTRDKTEDLAGGVDEGDGDDRFEEGFEEHDEQWQDLPGPRPDIPTKQEHIEGTEIPQEKVQEAWKYIANGGKYYSPSLGRVRRGKGEYKSVCTTGTWNVLHLLTGYPLPSNLNIDRTGERLNAMNCYKIHDSVDPTDPNRSGYVPKNGDVAVRPRFQSNHGPTQHMACYINGYWVSDTIQNRMSCYNATPQRERNPNEPNVQIYRFGAKNA